MVTFSMLSEIGSRGNNEDCVGMYQDGDTFCFALADGLGGHGCGEVASRMAVDAVIALFDEEGESTAFLERAFQAAQDQIAARQEADPACRDMKTTLVALTLGGQTAQWAHVGDSRLYYFENGKLCGRTLDHSVPQMLVSIGKIREKDIRRHPDRNRLLRVVGEDLDGEELNVTLSLGCQRKGRQAYLLCTDGFWELIEEKKMEALLRKVKTPEEWLRAMQEVVIKNGRNKNMDNYSAIAVWEG